MAATPDTKTFTSFFFNEIIVRAEYFFTNAPAEYMSNRHKILIEIKFRHPDTGEQIDLRVVKSILLLCQPKEVIEVVVHREIREFLQMFPESVSMRPVKFASGVYHETAK